MVFAPVTLGRIVDGEEVFAVLFDPCHALPIDVGRSNESSIFMPADRRLLVAGSRTVSNLGWWRAITRLFLVSAS